MDELFDGPGAPKTPTWPFWVSILVSPIAAAAATIAGGLLFGEAGVIVALALLAAIYVWFLAEEPAIRLMPAARRIAWVIAGLAISAAVVVASLFVFLVIVFSTWDFG
jgi:hypothetical protein